MVRSRSGRASKVVALLLMWAAITLTVHLLLSAEPRQWVWSGVVVALGFVGTWFIVRHGRGHATVAASGERSAA